MSVAAVRVILDERLLEDLRRRLAASRLLPPEAAAGATEAGGTDAGGTEAAAASGTEAGETWVRGTPGRWLAELVADWLAFDPGAFQARLDGLSHVRAQIDGLDIHAVHEPGRGPNPMPLLLTHGWPGSFCEFLEVLPLLTDPGAHGADPADSFSVVVPSLPGFGFSDPPPAGGFSASQVAHLWHQLMTTGLGYDRYVAHGTDLGAGVTARLARAHPDAVAGIHLATPSMPPPPQPWSEAETEYFAAAQRWTAEEGGYAHEHSTKPLTVGAALLDSPVGLAAWIGEKVTAWSSTKPDGQPAFDRELLLATLTLYWVTGTAASSLLPYWAYRQAPAEVLPADDPGVTPVAISVFGGEAVPFPKPPRQLAERYFSVSAWEELERGGHFPAVAEPELLAATLRNVFRPLRPLALAQGGG